MHKYLLAGLFILGSVQAETLSIAATPVPHAEILEFVTPLLKKEGIELDVKVFNDYVQPNIQVNEKHLDANYFQTIPYLEEFNRANKTELVVARKVHIEPLAIYSKHIKKGDAIPQNAKVSIPNDASNGGRALLLLHSNKIIELKDPSNPIATISDIISNPYNIQIIEVEAATLPRTLEDVDLSVINTNYALDAKLNPVKDSLFIEHSDSPYVNVIAVHKDRVNDEKIQKLVRALNSDEVKNFINEKYSGSVLPAF